MVANPAPAHDHELPELARRLIQSAGADRAAATSLCRVLGPRMRAFLFRYEKDAALAHDLAQDSLLVVLEALSEGRVTEPDRISAYALGVCRTSAKSAAKKRNRRQSLMSSFVAEAFAELPRLPSIELPRLGACFNRLPFRERQTLFETFFLEHDTHVIARTLATSDGNIRVLRHRGLELLRRCLGLEGAAP